MASMFDLNETFSSNILFHKRTFDYLAISLQQNTRELVKGTNHKRNVYTSRRNFSGNTHKAFYRLNLFDV